jgi:hypothetical protein
VATRSRYIHTIDGKAGYFVENAFAPGQGQICFLHNGVPLDSVLVDYKTLRRQRAETVRSRERFCGDVAVGRYHYIRVKVNAV